MFTRGNYKPTFSLRIFFKFHHSFYYSKVLELLASLIHLTAFPSPVSPRVQDSEIWLQSPCSVPSTHGLRKFGASETHNGLI